jgi:hypothetical protein
MSFPDWERESALLEPLDRGLADDHLLRSAYFLPAWEVQNLTSTA